VETISDELLGPTRGEPIGQNLNPDSEPPSTKIDFSNTVLTTSQQQEFRSWIDNWADIFANSIFELGRVVINGTENAYEHVIHLLPGAIPKRLRPYSAPQKLLPTLHDII